MHSRFDVISKIGAAPQHFHKIVGTYALVRLRLRVVYPEKLMIKSAVYYRDRIILSKPGMLTGNLERLRPCLDLDLSCAVQQSTGTPQERSGSRRALKVSVVIAASGRVMVLSLVIVGAAGALLGLWLSWRTIPLIGAVLFVAYAGKAWCEGMTLLFSVLVGFAPLFAFSAAFVTVGVLESVGRGASTIQDGTSEPAEQPGDAPNQGQ